METTPPVTTTFEPCAVYVAHDETPVCTTCGWLDVDHVEPVVEVRVREDLAA